MKLIAAALIATAFGAPPAPQSEQEPDYALLMSPAGAQKCEDEGGCAVYSRAYLEQLLDEARAQGAKVCNARKEI